MKNEERRKLIKTLTQLLYIGNLDVELKSQVVLKLKELINLL